MGDEYSTNHHQEQEIGKIKNEIHTHIHTHTKFNWQQDDSELHICIHQTSAFTQGCVETNLPRSDTHTGLHSYLCEALKPTSIHFASIDDVHSNP